MPTLPVELVPAIFQAVADTEIQPHTWWTATDTYFRFFDTASLVCKAWTALCHPYRNIYTIRSSLEAAPPKDWHTEFGRNGNNILNVVEGSTVLLHINKMAHGDHSLQIPHNMTSTIVKVQSRLAALSLQLELLQTQHFEQWDLVLSDRLLAFARSMKRLHIWSHAGYSTTHSETLQVAGSSITWVVLIGLLWPVWNQGIKQELALSTFNIQQTTDEHVLSARPVNKLVLSGIYVANRPEGTRLFSEVETLVLRQTSQWQANVPAFNLNWNVGQTLRNLHIVWSKDPFPIHSDNCDIFKSPNLEMIDIQAGKDFVVPGDPLETSPLNGLRDALREAKSLKYLVIEGIDLLGSNEDIGHLCAAFRSPEAAPALAALPQLTLYPSDASPVDFDINDRYLVNAGLAGLRKRGLDISQTEMDDTVWKHILKGPRVGVWPAKQTEITADSGGFLSMLKKARITV